MTTLRTGAEWMRHPAWGPVIIAGLAWWLIVWELDPGGDYPAQRPGPGLTVDEIFNAEQGVLLADRLLSFDFAGYRKVDTGLPDHPPLGRIWIGLCHEFSLLANPPDQEYAAVVIACARTGSATAFAALVLLIGLTAGRWYGTAAGWTGSAALVLMPRLFGHAHLAALETCICLTYAAAALAVASWWTASASQKAVAAAGVVWGLALLTKIQAILLPIPLVLWAVGWQAIRIWNLSRDQRSMRTAPIPANTPGKLIVQVLLRLAVWGGVGGLVFVACWPWVWSLEHLRGYVGSATERAAIYVWYFGEKYADRDVPWHYPWVLFAVTVPVGLHLLGFLGLFQGVRLRQLAPRETLLFLAGVFPLCLFSVPGVAVYDGERLFLICFPLWALSIARGGTAAFQFLASRLRPIGGGVVLAVFLLAQGVGGFLMSPCYLSYYNLLVGGVAGAERLGLATTYWGDGVLRPLIEEAAERAAPGETIALAPTLHGAQVPALYSQAPALRARGLKLVAWDERQRAAVKFLILFPRREYLPDDWGDGPPGAVAVAEVRRGGVRLAAVFDLHPDLSAEP